MEEWNQDKEEVVEQRPSTKYGRTAYENQKAYENQQQEMPKQEEEKESETEYFYGRNEEPKKEINDFFAYGLMLLVAISSVINMITTFLVSEAYYVGNTIEEVVKISLAIAEQPLYIVLTTLGDVVLMGIITLFLFDIVQIAKAGKKYVGAILFALFLRPAYFVWRAHLLGKKKGFPILYAIAVYLLSGIGLGATMLAATDMVMRTMIF